MAAARRCFSHDGFHQTSMQEIAQEAGLSAEASYRYFASKDEVILEIVGDAFRVFFEPVTQLVDTSETLTVADLVSASISPVAHDLTIDAAGQPVPEDELLRCAVQAWGELLRNEDMRERAVDGFEQVRRRMADVLRHGQAAGTVPPDLDPERGTRVVMALPHGFVLQRVAFGLDDTEGFISDVRAALADAGVLHPATVIGGPVSLAQSMGRTCLNAARSSRRGSPSSPRTPTLRQTDDAGFVAMMSMQHFPGYKGRSIVIAAPSRLTRPPRRRLSAAGRWARFPAAGSLPGWRGV